MAYKNTRENLEMKKRKNIDVIKYGELHMYYPIKFNTKLQFSELCDIIYQSKVGYNDDYHQKILDDMGSSLAETAEEIQNLFESHGDKIKINVTNPETNYIYNTENKNQQWYELNGDNIKIEITESESSVFTKITNMELEALQERDLRIQKELEVCSRICGKSFLEYQSRIPLIPFKMKLISGEIIWIQAMIIIFRNKMGLLKLNFPLININTKSFKEYNIDSLVIKIDNCWKNMDIDKNVKLSELYSYYLEKLFENKKLEIIKYDDSFNNLILVDYDGIPKQLNHISKDIQEEFFRIVCAPVPDYPYTSYSKDTVEYIKKFSLKQQHGIKYILKNNGGVLSVIDKNLQTFYLQQFKKEKNVETLDNNDYMYICSELASNINVNIEMSILIIMLKKSNELNNIYNKLYTTKELYKIRREYYQNILFINELQRTCYGSVIEQISEMEEKMPLYCNASINESNQIALDNILKGDQQYRSDNLLNFISIGSFIFTLVFGLPSIYEALKILQKTLQCTLKNVDSISMEKLSVTLWIILCVLIVIKVFRKSSSSHKGGVHN